MRRILVVGMRLLLLSSLFAMLAGCSSLYDYFGGAWKYQPEQREAKLSPGAKALLRDAFKGLERSGIADYHFHASGTGAPLSLSPPWNQIKSCRSVDVSGMYINPRSNSPFRPSRRFKFQVFRSASAVSELEQWTSQYIDRVIQLALHFGVSGANFRTLEIYLYAYDGYYDTDGSLVEYKTDLRVDNKAVVGLAECLNAVMSRAGAPVKFLPVISVHPARGEAAIDELKCYRGTLKDDTRKCGDHSRFLKWVPSAMNVDPSDERYSDFYEHMASLGYTLLTHTGRQPVLTTDKDKHDFGDPLRLAAPLKKGVNVVMLHSGAIGDRSEPERYFRNFLKMMSRAKNGEFAGKLYGDVSALQADEDYHYVLAEILKDFAKNGENSIFHCRLVRGSDYPVPAVKFSMETAALVKAELIDPGNEELLEQIYDVNPLLYEFALFRSLRDLKSGTRFPIWMFAPIEARGDHCID